MFCPCYYRMIYIKKSILLTNEKFLLGTTRITCLQNKLISRGIINCLRDYNLIIYVALQLARNEKSVNVDNIFHGKIPLK